MKKLFIIAAIALVSCNYKSRVNGKPIRHDTVFVYVHDTIILFDKFHAKVVKQRIDGSGDNIAGDKVINH